MAILDHIDIVALLIAFGSAVGFIWQRFIDRANRDNDRVKLLAEIDSDRLQAIRDEMRELRAELDAERERTAELRSRLTKLEEENWQLRTFGRPEDQTRIAELEARVAHLEAENNTLRGAK